MPHTLTADIVSKLVDVEYQFVGIGADLENLITLVRTLPIPGASAAARNLGTIRAQLACVLARIDEPITQAVRAFEAANAIDAVEAYDPYADCTDIPF